MCRQIENLILAERENLLREFSIERETSFWSLVELLMSQNKTLSSQEATELAKTVIKLRDF